MTPYVIGFAGLVAVCSVPVLLGLMAWSRPESADAMAKVLRSLEPMFLVAAVAISSPKLLVERVGERWRSRRGGKGP